MKELLDVMAALRDPERGCPWDLEQTFESISRHTIEEAYEVADAIRRGDMAELREELGDLLFQVAFYSQMAREAGVFDFRDVEQGIVTKMRRRHPHVFGAERVSDAREQTVAWERHKAEERARKAAGGEHSRMDGVARALPALVRAEKLQKRAAKAGFDWSDVRGVFEKVREELGELEDATDGADPGAVADELGDVLFSCCNLARHLGVDAEHALRAANDKFEGRFRTMERAMSDDGIDLEGTTPEEMDRYWEAAKDAAAGHDA